MLRQRRKVKNILSIMLLFVLVLSIVIPTDAQGVKIKAASAEDGNEPEKEDVTEEDKKSVDAEKDAEIEDREEIKEETVSTDEEKTEVTDDSAVTVPVPIYNYDIVNVVLPTSYSVALNPYELPVKTKDGTVSSAQVVSQNYGIVNKSTRDKVVTATFTIEDENEGKIVFVGSREEALNADKDTYAIYLSVVPADDTGIKVDGDDADKDTSAEALSNVVMNKAGDHAIVLSEGESKISFKLSKAVYEFGGSEEIVLNSGQEAEEIPKLTGLAADNGGATAFTFDGVMNPKADWSKLTKGVRISVTYDYDNAAGDEKIVDGTGAMTER